MSRSPYLIPAAEISRQIDMAERSLERIRSAQTAEQLRDGWEQFLGAHSRAMGRIISLAMKTPVARGWGNRIKNLSTKDDEGLVYLRKARGAAEHSLEPFAKFADPGASLSGGLLYVDGPGTVVIEAYGNVVNGVQDGDYVATVSGGKLVNMQGQPSRQTYETPARIWLRPILSEDKKKTFQVPKTILGRPVPEGRCQELAELGFECLNEIYGELRKELRMD